MVRLWQISVIILISLLIFNLSCKDSTDPNPGSPGQNYSYQVIRAYPHDPAAFTQGLEIEGDTLFEGTGLYGRSSLRKVDLATGAVLQQKDLSSQYFGEGITIFDQKIFQLTWLKHTGFIYDRDSFAQTGTFAYDTEGWGLTHDGTNLIMSDGSNIIRYLDPDSLTMVREIEVKDAGSPVNNLNELEYIENKIYANIWMTNKIAIISPESGRVTALIDLTNLLNPEDCSNQVNVLNGIAYDPVEDRLFVTGKLWCKLFEIKIVPQNSS